MNFSKSRVLSTLLLCALAVAFSGVAEAQSCFTQVSGANMVRAEGLTEVVGGLRVLCRQPADVSDTNPFGGGVAPLSFKLALELNTRITNEITDSRVVQMRTVSSTGPPVVTANHYTDGGITLMARENTAAGAVDATGTPIPATSFGDGKLSDDGTMITWTLYSRDDPDTTDTEANVNLEVRGTDGGFTLNLSGIRANAAMLGNGEDVMANVLVNGTAVNAAPLKLSDVSTGIELDLGAESGLQCNKSSVATRVSIKEGYASAWMAMPSMADDTNTGDVNEAMAAFADTFLVTVSHVPEGVKVSVPTAIELEMDQMDGGVNEMLGSVAVDLVMCRTCGTDSDGVVELSASGTGQFRYKIRTIEASDGPDETANTDDDIARSSTVQDDLAEWVHVPITFSWDAGAPDLGHAGVDVAFYPGSDHGGDTFMVGGAAVPRFSEHGVHGDVLTINDCMTTLFYPFVTSSSGYDTGIVISNTSSGAGSCMATFSGYEDSMDLGEVMPGMQSIFLVSDHMEDFSGYLEVACDIESASGFAHVVDSSGLAGSQGYIAQCSSVNEDACK